MKPPVFVGVDVAGEDRTWMAALRLEKGKLEVLGTPKPTGLESIVHFCEEEEVVAIALDAPLTAALSDKHGRRSSDRELSGLLPPACQWVMSVNSMMAVPVRGQLLAEALSPIVGTILETHPRACLFFAAGHSVELRMAVERYKGKGPEAKRYVKLLWHSWQEFFGIGCKEPQNSHDALDSLVCATIAYLYHLEPESLTKLIHKAVKRYGRGPFLVLDPKMFKQRLNLRHSSSARRTRSMLRLGKRDQRG